MSDDLTLTANLLDEREKLVVAGALRLAAASEHAMSLTRLDPAHLTYLAALVDRDVRCKKTETSTSIALWAEETFGPATALSTAIRAQKELTELIEKLSDSVHKREVDPLVIMEEVADVRIVLARVQRFFPGAPTAEEAEDAKMQVNRVRRWRLDGRGHGQHVGDDEQVNTERANDRTATESGPERKMSSFRLPEGTLLIGQDIWFPEAVAPQQVWLRTRRDGEDGENICMLGIFPGGDREWAEQPPNGRSTVTHGSFAAPTHWTWPLQAEALDAERADDRAGLSMADALASDS